MNLQKKNIKERSDEMLFLRIVIYSAIFLTCSIIGVLKSRKYVYRVNELREFKNALNMFKAKINFTYEPIPEIFEQISESSTPSIGGVFKKASYNMNFKSAGEAWNTAVETDILNINAEDRNILKNLGRLLGKTDLKGQVNQIDLTSSFLDNQIRKAELEREKNEKMYRTLGMILGLGIVIILI